MRPLMATGPRTAYGEDAAAVVRALFGLTAGVGAFAAAGAASTGQLPLIVVPTLALLCSLVLRTPIVLAASAAASVWLILLPMVSGEGLLVPAMMLALCLAIAVGPDRLLSWLASDAAPALDPPAPGGGWIEEDDGRIG